MRCFAIIVTVLLVILNLTTPTYSLVQFFRNLIQNNVAGIPLVHKQQSFDFDPEISVKRRPQYYELHGYRGEKLIERSGLGIDGKHQDRLQQQQNRDSGILQGANYQKEYNLLQGRNYNNDNTNTQ